METQKGSNISSSGKKWKNLFVDLVRTLQTRQAADNEYIAKDRKFLQDRFKLEYERRVSDVSLLRDHISEMKRYHKIHDMARNVEEAKFELVVGLKQREAFSYKMKLDDAASELEDFREWFDYLSSKCSETEDNNSKMEALLSERNFVWNQYKMRESDLTDRLKSKSTEVEQANEKIQNLLTSMEILQSSNSEKDKMILNLKTDMAELEAASVKKSEEISRLSRELELVRKARSNSITPVLRHCSAKSRLGEENRVTTEARNVIPKKESHPSRVIIHKGCGSSKRRAFDPIPISETPKLFTSAFKVPKLKSASPHVI